jgi:hypothetical protein
VPLRPTDPRISHGRTETEVYSTASRRLLLWKKGNAGPDSALPPEDIGGFSRVAPPLSVEIASPNMIGNSNPSRDACQRIFFGGSGPRLS